LKSGSTDVKRGRADPPYLPRYHVVKGPSEDLKTVAMLSDVQHYAIPYAMYIALLTLPRRILARTHRILAGGLAVARLGSILSGIRRSMA
jgi:hypothetical protein